MTTSSQVICTQTFVGTGIGPTGVSQLFGYDIAKHDPRRPPTVAILRSEDWELDDPRRRVAVAEARDIRRNFSIVTWAIRKHLDFVSRFTFQSKIGDEEIDPRYADRLDKETAETLNRQVEELIYQWSRPGNFDVTGRYSRNQFMRLAEAARVIDGDIGILKLADGTIQAIEGDRIRSDYGSYFDEWVQGVKPDMAGRPLSYKVWRRTGHGGGNFEFERIVPASNIYFTYS